MILRRSMLGMLATGGFASAVAPVALAAKHAIGDAGGATLRGALDPGEQGLRPDGSAGGGRDLSVLLQRAARSGQPVFLPPGTYAVSDLELPDGIRITGVPGLSRITYTGSGRFLHAAGATRFDLANLVIDGGGLPLGGDAPALLDLKGVQNLSIENCDVIGASGSGIQLDGCGGRIRGCTISKVSDYGLYAVDSTGLSVTDNVVRDCGNGGILIHRHAQGADGTMVTGNRIDRIGAGNGGTGQFGNGINLFRADRVMVSGNQISSAAFSAIRANSASDVLISGNQCFSSGETAIYAEFSFQGAVVSNNVIDGSANGISVVNFNEGGRLATVSGNIVRNLTPTGPYVLDGAIFGVGISVEADTSITGNVVEGAPLWGLALGFGPYLRNITATGNIVRQARIGCAVSVVEGAGNAVITGNVFQAMSAGAIIGHRWKDAATGELATGGGAASYPNLTIADNRVN